MDGGDIIGLTAVVLIFSTPLVAMLSGVMKAKYRAQAGSLSEKDREDIERLKATAGSMHERIETLESILDSEVPGWREDHES